MNFLFYPSLTNPVKEQEINQGRKRIDLSYNNAQESKADSNEFKSIEVIYKVVSENDLKNKEETISFI